MKTCWQMIPALVMVSLASAAAAGQTEPRVTPMEEAPVPTGPAPRLANGKPDFNGIWDRPYVPDVTEVRPGHAGIVELPFTAEGLDNWTSYAPMDGDYTANCFPYGLPRSINGPFPMQIIQTETHLAFLFELGTWFHVVPLDGRDHPEDLEPTWYGHSVGR